MARYIPYLTFQDYIPIIQESQLSDQILGNLVDGSVQRKFCEGWAIERIYGKLKTEYDLDFEFTHTLPFNPNKTYKANERVSIDFPDWVSAKLYEEKDCIIYDGNGYICLSQNQDSVFDDSKWRGIGKQYDLFYIKLPEKLFSYEIQKQKGAITDGFYKVGDKVWWENHTYECKLQTSLASHEEQLQYVEYKNVPNPNSFPNDLVAGKSQWIDLGEWTLDNSNLPEYPTDANPEPAWTLGDNRNATMVSAVMSLSLWMLHKRISPQNIPKLRENDKEEVFKWLTDIKKDEEEVDVPMLQPSQGTDIRWGSNVKQRNGYG